MDNDDHNITHIYYIIINDVIFYLEKYIIYIFYKIINYLLYLHFYILFFFRLFIKFLSGIPGFLIHAIIILHKCKNETKNPIKLNKILDLIIKKK